MTADLRQSDPQVDLAGKLRVHLLGPFQMIAPDGTDLTPRRQKANALLALVAVADRGQRARSWLCSRLWSDRSQEQALGSLRQSLTDLRRALGDDWEQYLRIDAFNVSINLANVWVDVLHLRDHGTLGGMVEPGEFLEGIDIRDDEFEDWLAVERSHWQRLREPGRVIPIAPAAMTLPTTGNGTLTFSVGGRTVEVRILDEFGGGMPVSA